MTDEKKKVVRRTAAERKAALEAELLEIELKEIDKARKDLDAKRERLAKVTAFIAKYEDEANVLESEIAALEAMLPDYDEPGQEEPVVSPFSQAG